MDASLARGHAAKAIRDAAARSVQRPLAQAAGHRYPLNRIGQNRWLQRVTRAAKPALIGAPAVRYGKRFVCSLPVLAPMSGKILRDDWKGIALGQATFSASSSGQEAWSWTLLALDLHVLTRIGQRADVVGLDDVVAFVAPALPWCMPHWRAAEAAGADRVWLPLASGVLVCRFEDAIGSERAALFAATYIAEARLSPFKSRTLAEMRAAQADVEPGFPLVFEDPRHVEAWAAGRNRLVPIYSKLSRAEDARAA